jgi:hypothetical protein
MLRVQGSNSRSLIFRVEGSRTEHVLHLGVFWDQHLDSCGLILRVDGSRTKHVLHLGVFRDQHLVRRPVDRRNLIQWFGIRVWSPFLKPKTLRHHPDPASGEWNVFGVSTEEKAQALCPVGDRIVT